MAEGARYEAQQPELFQKRAWYALCGPEPHILLAGGARSGKTFTVCQWLGQRCFEAPEATHAVLRLRFNHLKASIIYDTLPQVLRTKFPGVEMQLNKSDWYADLCGAGRGRIYFGGLDDKERTEKILGQGHSTIYINEGSQVGYGARNKAVTRLSQQRGCYLKEVVDENPPMQGHWTHRLWLKKTDPDTNRPLHNPDDYFAVMMNPATNPHIPEATKQILRNLPPRERLRFWLGQFGDAVDGPLWTYESIERSRVDAGDVPATLTRLIIAVDPSGCHGAEDDRSDEVGIVVAAVDERGVGYVLEDASGKYGPGGKDGWGVLVARLYRKWQADCVVAETNFGGAMVGAVILAADPDVPFREVSASRGKAVRAEPVATMFDRGMIRLAGTFPELEQQLIQFSTAGYQGDRSPDRADAMVWAMSELVVGQAEGLGLLRWYQQQAQAEGTATDERPPAATDPDDPYGWLGTIEDGRRRLAQRRREPDVVRLMAPADHRGVVYAVDGSRYTIEADGSVRVPPGEGLDSLLACGYRRID